MTPRLLPTLFVLCTLCACQRTSPAPDVARVAAKTVQTAGVEDSGAVSSDAKPSGQPDAKRLLKEHAWPRMRLTSGEASIACDAGTQDGERVADASPSIASRVVGAVKQAGAADAEPSTTVRTGRDGSGDDRSATDRLPADAAERGAGREDGEVPTRAGGEPVATVRAEVSAHALSDLDFDSVSAAMTPCRETGVVRLRYAGKISGDFTALVQRVAVMADRLAIARRVLDIDSTGGRLEDAMPAGDTIAESHWTIRVGRDAICHSACVLVLAAGDSREIAGRIGIHRMIRVGSRADSRAELRSELREVYGELKDYLERNGASVAVADLMMTVPNRSLRLLSDDELREYGLAGENAVQDDLDRIRLARRCGEDFVRRRDAYTRAFESECALAASSGGADDPSHRDGVDACATGLRERFAFPDARCPADGPAPGLLDRSEAVSRR